MGPNGILPSSSPVSNRAAVIQEYSSNINNLSKIDKKKAEFKCVFTKWLLRLQELFWPQSNQGAPTMQLPSHSLVKFVCLAKGHTEHTCLPTSFTSQIRSSWMISEKIRLTEGKLNMIH